MSTTRAPESDTTAPSFHRLGLSLPREALEGGRLLLVFGVTLLALLMPLLLIEHPRMVDLPNHLARHYIGGAIAGSATLQSFYEFSWRLVPNVAGDALYVPLSWFLSPYDAARVIFGLSVALWLAAPLVLHRALWGRYSLWPLFAALVIYNANVAWGFENYLLASALSVLLFALWITWRGRLNLWRGLLFAALATGLYLGHLVAFGLLGLLMLTYEAGDLWRTRKQGGEIDPRRLGIALLPFLPGALHFLSILLASGAGHGSGTEIGTLAARVKAIFSPTLQSVGLSDLWTFALIVAVFLFGLLQRKWLRLHPAMLPVLLVVALAALAAPSKLMGVYFIHYRLPFVAIALLIAATRWELPSPALRQGFLAVMAAVLVVRLLDITASWREYDAEAGEMVAAFRQLEEGPRILSVAGKGVDPGPQHWHATALAVIERQAFTPTLFTGAHLLRTTPALRELDRPHSLPVPLADLAAARAGSSDAGSPPERYWETWWRDYSHLLILDRAPEGNPFPDLLEPVARGAVFVLYRNRGFDAAGQP